MSIALYYQPDILATQVNRFVVAPGVFIMQHLDDCRYSASSHPERLPNCNSAHRATSGAQQEKWSDIRRLEETALQYCKAQAADRNQGYQTSSHLQKFPVRATMPQFHCVRHRHRAESRQIHRRLSRDSLWQNAPTLQSTGFAPGNDEGPDTCLPPTRSWTSNLMPKSPA